MSDALVEPSIELPDDEVVIVVVQRSLSDESLPHEMLIEEIEDDEAEVIGNKPKFQKDIKDEKSEIPTQICEFAKQSSSVEDSFKTPPPSPELKCQSVYILTNFFFFISNYDISFGNPKS